MLANIIFFLILANIVLLSIRKSLCLVLVIYLDDDDSDVLVIAVVGNLGNVPIVREEDKELVRCAVVEAGTGLVVIVVDYVWTIFTVRLAGKMVDDTETLHTLYYILEVYVMVVTFAATLFQWIVLAVFYAYCQVGTWDRVLSFRDCEEVGSCYKIE